VKLMFELLTAFSPRPKPEPSLSRDNLSQTGLDEDTGLLVGTLAIVQPSRWAA
jgi:hypothetical protein